MATYTRAGRALRFESLENRRLLAITVNTLVDENDGVAVGGISLRDAIVTAAPGETIDFAASLTSGGPATILLTHGELAIDKNLTITGPGANLLTINASGNDATPDIDQGDGSSVLRVENATSAVAVTIAGLVFTGGDSYFGGAIYNTETLTLQSCVITGNSSVDFGGGIASGGNLNIFDCLISNNTAAYSGGGVSGIEGTLTIERSQIVDNRLTFESEAGYLVGGAGIWTSVNTSITDSSISNNISANVGGGLTSNGGDLSITGTSISYNSGENGGGGIYLYADYPLVAHITDCLIDNNESDADGGGIVNANASLYVLRSTIQGNGAQARGGGMFSYGTASIVDSTFTSNHAVLGGAIAQFADPINLSQVTITANSAESGGAIYLAQASVVVRFSTIAYNSASEFGGGMELIGGSAVIENTIIAQNTALFGPDITRLFTAIISAKYSLIGNNAESSLAEAPVGSPDINGNLIGGPVSGSINPRLLPLADNGGPTRTMGLSFDSPAVNAGDPAAVAGAGTTPAYDQAGSPYVRVFNGRVDIGAFEYQILPPVNYVVDTLQDGNDGNYSAGNLSLREAILLASRGRISSDVISFAPSLFAGGPASIVLTQGQLNITSSLSIHGPGRSLLTIDASGNDPIPATNTGNGSRVLLINDSLTALVDVEIRGVKLAGGDASGNGGAINNQEHLSLIDCALTDNAAMNFGLGGAIYSQGRLDVTNCVISSNYSEGSGGAISAQAGEILLVGSELVSNTARGAGGAIFASAKLSIFDSRIESNTAEISVGGGINFAGNVDYEIRNTVVRANNAGKAGGGIYGSGRFISIADTVIDANTAGMGGGGLDISTLTSANGSIQITGCTITNNAAPLYPAGGANITGPASISNSLIANNSGSQAGGLYLKDGTISNSIINGNHAALEGGGIFAVNATVINCTINDNSSATSGGGVFGAGLTLVASSVYGNSAVTGAGVRVTWFSGPNNQIVSSTISSNIATSGGGGIDGSLHMDLSNCTITANTAPAGSGGGLRVIGTGNKPTLSSNIISGNFGGDVYDWGHLSNGYNLVGTFDSPDAFSAVGDQVGITNPVLGLLADNGGPTKTHMPLPGSPAIDAGNPASVAGSGGVPLNDQRGAPYLRIYDGDGTSGARLDIGAVERQPIIASAAGDYNLNGTVDAADFVLWRKQQGVTNTSPFTGADGNGDGIVNPIDYTIWRSNFGRVISPLAAGSAVEGFGRGGALENSMKTGSGSRDVLMARIGSSDSSLSPAKDETLTQLSMVPDHSTAKRDTQAIRPRQRARQLAIFEAWQLRGTTTAGGINHPSITDAEPTLEEESACASEQTIDSFFAFESAIRSLFEAR